jgi:hypothetical protein
MSLGMQNAECGVRNGQGWSSVMGHSVVALASLLNLSAAAAATKTNTGAAVVVLLVRRHAIGTDVY